MQAVRLMPRLHIAVIQFAPKIGQVAANIATVNKLCRDIKPFSIDLLCLPEMSFTGYVFPSALAISPFLEHPMTGPTSMWLGCYVVTGYPELLAEDESRPLVDDEGTESVGANSATVYGPNGVHVVGYRKTNLFTTDQTWAKPGTGFTTFPLTFPYTPPVSKTPPVPSTTLTVSLGICMDLNPHPPNLWDEYEIASHCQSTQSNVLILLNAWLDTTMDIEVDEEEERDAMEPDWQTTTCVVVCNRTWVRKWYSHPLISRPSQLFAGSSAIFRMKPSHPAKPHLLDIMGCREEGVRFWDIDVGSP
ncbi:carbon-nitrogen hydrolase [Desarmillaria tabescens]|uniref:Carbon-nitrogen hydrolase n=1 Tax=Armillaria tabescens TaxID=1929756 RepID=A0AA39ND92_ARMTA|nr:carbon-nitrogen hydrolase [Desarmillaria tabescens]KAK0463479.1 carbon-nitrogen hydrolase [Desarmillaria tabescens]